MQMCKIYLLPPKPKPTPPERNSTCEGYDISTHLGLSSVFILLILFFKPPERNSKATIYYTPWVLFCILFFFKPPERSSTCEGYDILHTLVLVLPATLRSITVLSSSPWALSSVTGGT